MIKAPFTIDQIVIINEWQQAQFTSEILCGSHHAGDRVLVATQSGMKCPSCNYTQEWVPDFMVAELPVDFVKAADMKKRQKEHEEFMEFLAPF